jgi:hypothetical protein
MDMRTYIVSGKLGQTGNQSHFVEVYETYPSDHPVEVFGPFKSKTEAYTFVHDRTGRERFLTER